MLSRLTSLQQLTMMGCNMQALPAALSSLRNLRVLYLGACGRLLGWPLERMRPRVPPLPPRGLPPPPVQRAAARPMLLPFLLPLLAAQTWASRLPRTTHRPCTASATRCWARWIAWVGFKWGGAVL